MPGRSAILSSDSIGCPSVAGGRTYISHPDNSCPMARLYGDDQGVSPQIGALLLTVVTMILFLVVLAIVLSFQLSFDLFPQDEPCIFEIEKVTHNDEKFASRVTLWYNKTPTQPVDDVESRLKKLFGWERVEPDREKVYDTDDLWARFYRNGELIDVKIPTLYTPNFIKTHHYGVQTTNGRKSWCQNGKITINFKDRTFRPGDTVRVEIYSKSEERLISADTYIA